MASPPCVAAADHLRTQRVGVPQQDPDKGREYNRRYTEAKREELNAKKRAKWAANKAENAARRSAKYAAKRLAEDPNWVSRKTPHRDKLSPDEARARKLAQQRAYRESEAGKAKLAAMRETVNAKNRAKRAANLDAAREYSRAWHAENRERANERKRNKRERIRLTDPTRYAKECEAARRYAEREGLDKRRKRWNDWAKSAPHVIKAARMRRMAKVKNAPGELSADFLHELYQEQMRCWYCQRVFDADVRPTVEHKIPLARGGSHLPENVTLACLRCNAQKNNRTVDEYREYLWKRLLLQTQGVGG